MKLERMELVKLVFGSLLDSAGYAQEQRDTRTMNPCGAYRDLAQKYSVRLKWIEPKGECGGDNPAKVACVDTRVGDIVHVSAFEAITAFLLRTIKNQNAKNCETFPLDMGHCTLHNPGSWGKKTSMTPSSLAGVIYCTIGIHHLCAKNKLKKLESALESGMVDGAPMTHVRDSCICPTGSSVKIHKNRHPEGKFNILATTSSGYKQIRYPYVTPRIATLFRGFAPRPPSAEFGVLGIGVALGEFTSTQKGTSQGRESGSHRFAFQPVANSSVEFLTCACKAEKSKQFRDAMFDRPLCRFFNGWMGSRDKFVWDFYCWDQKFSQREIEEGITAEQFTRGLMVNRENGMYVWNGPDAPVPEPVTVTIS
ncbi:hypothetical protein DFH08DRAFT_811717 [Mycena albidolilacea]|uniref:Uncharacterized protein n=1 Tax=Mycena albidolilacea TaxID=1033008 RepID=A0AAD6ZWN1_9AGAR|nr:hypothetical protein DFH08DRAFT_811717 [Mycena albidolilacea]